MKKILSAVAISIVVLLSTVLVLHLGQKPSEESPYLFTRDWIGKGNLWVFDQPPLAYLRELGATGTAFSVYYHGFNEYDWDYVKTLHRHGFKVTANLPLGQGTTTENMQLREEAAKRDIHNNPIFLLGLEGLYNMCGNHPLWREFLMNRIAEQARGGVDGILLDEPGDLGDCFCDHCMQAFNHYLADHYSPGELQHLFGIADLSSFNYREYLLAHGGSHWWDDPNQQLQTAYLQFRYSERVKFIGELIQHARQAAGWELPVTANVYGLEPNHQIFVPLLDFVIFEMPLTLEVHPNMPHLRPRPGKHFTTYLLAEALDPEKSFSAFPDVFELLHLSEDEWWLWRQWLAEARALGASFMIPYQAYVYGGERSYTLPADRISPYIRFFAEHPQYYENLERIAKIALLYDLHSTLINQYTWRTCPAWESFENLGLMLQEAHLPFEVVYRGDGKFVKKPLTLEGLEKYSVVVVPRYYDLDQDTLNLLQQYSAGGGLVLKCDDLADDSQLIPTLKGLKIDFGLETNASQDLSLVAYRGKDSLLVHLINYRYNRQALDFSDLTNIRVTLTLPEGLTLEGKTLKILSPDEGELTLDFIPEGGRVTFTLPRLHCYSVASFE
ncbi:MAG: hypothetical protein DSO03_03610 [Hadesarchaea archaeon]|nr:MAG: hypothetical protein DSO03_03610 [Hadesarchaea archaeon]